MNEITYDLDENNEVVKTKINSKEVNQMASLKDTALAYEPKQTLNITELNEISVDVDVKHEVRKNSEGEEYSIDFIIKDEKEYRVPASVLEGIKVQVEANPKLEKVKVTKTGEGKATKYTVVPLV